MLVSFFTVAATAKAASTALTVAKILIPIGTTLVAAQPVADAIKSRR